VKRASQKAAELPAKWAVMVRLYGTVVRTLEGRVLFRVAAHYGDAQRLGFDDGAEFWVGRRQGVLTEATEAPVGGVPLDLLKVSFELASYLAQTLAEAS